MREDGATDPPRDWLEKCQWTQNMLAAHADKEREREREIASYPPSLEEDCLMTRSTGLAKSELVIVPSDSCSVLHCLCPHQAGARG